ncbi:sugar phosphate isomerase/epimerase family protein [Halomonas cupida]|uniref:sugar phosphate isomerase/epimerase family protein n=1 Tax=Halomonas cupida TaxID=44933 RepID=UPI003A90C19F
MQINDNNSSTTLLARHLLVSGLAMAMVPVAMATEETSKAPIAVQMYTLRDFGTLEEQFSTVADAGVGAVELVGDQGIPADQLNQLLDSNDLEVSSSHVQLEDLRQNLDEVVAFHKAIGNDTLVVPYLDESQRPMDEAGWQALGEELGTLARELAEQDLRLAYHNHDFEMETFGDQTAMEVLFDAAGPDLYAEVDVAWVARGGLDPAQYLANFDDRLFAIHVKDNAPKGEAEDEKGFAIPGQGVLDWQSILPAADQAGVEWYVIEHDLPADAAAVVMQGAEFLEQALASDVAE